MKKIVALLMALCLLTGIALAESNEVSWADVEAAAADIDGNFVAVADLGIKMFLPAVFHEAELTEDDVNNGYITYLTTEDQSAAVAVMYGAEGTSLEDFAANTLPGVGATEIEAGVINGIPVVTYEMPENDSVNVAMGTDTGYIIEFIFYPASDEGMKQLAAIMTASIQAA